MSIYLRRGNNDDIIVNFDYSIERVGKMKLIPGSQYDSKLNCWTIPYAKDAYNKLLGLFRNEDRQ